MLPPVQPRPGSSLMLPLCHLSCPPTKVCVVPVRFNIIYYNWLLVEFSRAEIDRGPKTASIASAMIWSDTHLRIEGVAFHLRIRSQSVGVISTASSKYTTTLGSSFLKGELRVEPVEPVPPRKVSIRFIPLHHKQFRVDKHPDYKSPQLDGRVVLCPTEVNRRGAWTNLDSVASVSP